ncbi:hypothetical protein [Pseudomonas mangiferae]|uniref:Transmembrane protein n=1 Tax=Pseudomonas mangiferae TaxID=2593654 RepID=A0A553H2U1_9PSED|nr:hypothetical protein [Pseudomonas mangiferae]TRX76064.1 hypothetical protein FM069_02430 [Pseudomonas mangiferae]
MNKPFLYAVLYTTCCVAAFSAGSVLFGTLEAGPLLALGAGVLFALRWRPTVIAILASGLLYAALFNLDLHEQWYWLSDPKSEEAGIFLLFAGVGPVLPLLATWITAAVWRAIRARHGERRGG